MSSEVRYPRHKESYPFPDLLELEPVHSCNLKCRMCHVSFEKLTHQKLDIDRFLARMPPKDIVEGKWVGFSSTHEPVCHPGFVDAVKALSDLGMNVYITTNGTLVTKEKADALARAHIKHVCISFDGVKKETYEAIRVGGKYERALERIRYLKRVLDRQYTFFQVNYVIVKSDLEEIADAVDFWEAEGFDHIKFIAMTVRSTNETMASESIIDVLPVVEAQLLEAARRVIEKGYRITVDSPMYLQHSTLRSQYPNHFQDHIALSANPLSKKPFNPRFEYQNGYWEGMPVDCRSPFTFARINWSGDFLMCHKIRIGSIYETDFMDLWNGERANKVRSTILKNPKVCRSCTYFQYCVKSTQLDYTDPENFYGGDYLCKTGREYKNPTVVERLHDYNIVAWMGDFYGLPRSIGSVDVRFDDVAQMDNVFVSRDIDRVKSDIENRHFEQTGDIPAGMRPGDVAGKIAEYLKARKLEAAIRLSLSSVNHFSSDPMVWLSHGRILNLFGATEEAVVAVERALALDETADGLILLSTLYARLNDETAMNRVADRVRKNYPDRAGEVPVSNR